MENKSKLFAFKLASKNDAKQNTQVEAKDGKWAARNGAAVAGCTDYRFVGNLRYSDNGVYC
jgi:hypothetical protein